MRDFSETALTSGFLGPLRFSRVAQQAPIFEFFSLLIYLLYNAFKIHKYEVMGFWGFGVLGNSKSV